MNKKEILRETINSEIYDYHAEKKDGNAQNENFKHKFAEELINGLGDDMKNTLNEDAIPKKENKIKKFFIKLMMTCENR